MERFLEIILQVEKEAGGLEDNAGQSLADIERDYCLALARLEGTSLKELYRNLAKQKEEQTVEITRLGQEIAIAADKECAILEEAGKKIIDKSIELVVSTLLPDSE